MNPDITIAGEYISARTKIHCVCKICGNEFDMMPNAILCGQSCPVCGLQKRAAMRTKSQEEFVADLKAVQPNIEIIGPYIGSHKLVKCRCAIDGAEWESYPANLLNKSAGCPVCKFTMSRGERAVDKYLQERQVEFTRQYRFGDCRNVRPLRFDFYLPAFNIAIEFDGAQHFVEVPYFDDHGGNLELNIKRDKIKNDYCQMNGIKLIRIPYTEEENIEEILDYELAQYDPQRLSYPA